MSTKINITNIFRDHTSKIIDGFNSIDLDLLTYAAEIIFNNIRDGWTIYTCGNGASAAIAQHWACDYTKGCSNLSKNIKTRVVSLSANIPLMTAISNDVSYDEVYSYQLERLAYSQDLLICISSSGNSPNIVKALESAKKMGIKSIALTGFDGGKAKELATVCIHVDIHEYEATEAVHQAIMHMVAKARRNEFNV